ncbi:MAG: tetratricopeptide repeat protein [Halarcobacter ebronensis]|uniref:tetratricopeptide repeat protein n=1 Tax=Halarcobacter ebronensis TaxID=1462615 RepID=UPI003C777ABD
MIQNKCTIYSSTLYTTNREKQSDALITKKDNCLDITFCEEDDFDKFEEDLSSLCGNSFSYYFKKRVSSSIISIISIVVIMFAFLSVSIYEDLLKKIVFEMPFDWETNDSIALGFVLLFLFGLFLMPSILEAKRSEFKNILASWLNKDIKKQKRVSLAFSSYDKKTQIDIYNIDLFDKEHWVYKILLKALFKKFSNINIHVRNDEVKKIEKRLSSYNITNIEIVKEKPKAFTKDINFLFSSKEQKLNSLLQLCSTKGFNTSKAYVSLELFEYCGKNLFESNEKSEQLTFGFQNFINRSFDDFKFLRQEDSSRIYFTSNFHFKVLSDEQRRLAYFLRNHIEECIEYFDNPISLLVLYNYVKDIVLDERRVLNILERFIVTIEKRQQYKLIDEYWFDIAGKMFDSYDLKSFETTKESIYRKLSVESLNLLLSLFERNGYFEQAILLAKYLYEINPNKYSVLISSLYERMGLFDEAFSYLPKELQINENKKPSEIEIKYLQRKAWIIVSQRKEELRQEGKETLEKLFTLISSHNEDNEAIWLWHYYNIKANYEEWDCNFEEAIKNYKKCLGIPTLGAFEYGATFVNMAIAYRFTYLTSTKQKDANIIHKSIYYGKVGLQLKESVGDRDELPVVQHNQALNILYKELYSIQKEEELLNEALSYTSEAIEILDSTGSIKRLGMILMENIICKQLLQVEFDDIVTRLKEHLVNLDDNELKQLLNLYKEFKKANKITAINFLEND